MYQHEKTIEDVKIGDIKVLCDDLKVKVGSDNWACKKWQIVKEIAELIADFYINQYLVFGETIFQHLNIHKFA